MLGRRGRSASCHWGGFWQIALCGPLWAREWPLPGGGSAVVLGGRDYIPDFRVDAPCRSRRSPLRTSPPRLRGIPPRTRQAATEAAVTTRCG